MKKILYLVLFAFVMIAGPAFADTCYRVVEYYPPEMWGTYRLKAHSDLSFVTETGEWGVWGTWPTGTMMYFQFWHTAWDYPYLFLSGTTKGGFCQADTGISGSTGRVGYYTLKKLKLAECNFADKAAASAESARPREE